MTVTPLVIIWVQCPKVWGAFRWRISCPQSYHLVTWCLVEPYLGQDNIFAPSFCTNIWYYKVFKGKEIQKAFECQDSTNKRSLAAVVWVQGSRSKFENWTTMSCHVVEVLLKMSLNHNIPSLNNKVFNSITKQLANMPWFERTSMLKVITWIRAITPF